MFQRVYLYHGRPCAQNIWRENHFQSWWGMIAALAGAVVSGYLLRSAWVRAAVLSHMLCSCTRA